MNELVERLQPFWSEAKVCRELTLTTAQLRDLEANGDILALPTSDETPVNLYPVDQFERADGQVRVRPALRAAFRELHATDAWTVALAILRTPARELDDQAPLVAARNGTPPETLAAYARLLAAEWR